MRQRSMVVRYPMQEECNCVITFAGGIQSPVAFWGWVVECIGSQHVLWIMWMAHPNQADRPQGSHHVSDGTLAANDLGTGSGWQQSKQNWARPAVVGYWARMKCNDPCCVQDVRLHPILSKYIRLAW